MNQTVYTQVDPVRAQEFTSSILKDIIFTLITFGIYYFFIQARQIRALNDMLGEEKYSFIKWFFFSIITFGIYHLYHEYIMASDIMRAMGIEGSHEPLLCLGLAAFGFPIVADAVMQSSINRFYGKTSL